MSSTIFFLTSYLYFLNKILPQLIAFKKWNRNKLSNWSIFAY